MQLPLDLDMPKSMWKAPQSLPNLSMHNRIAVDVETRDPGLTAKGPGFNRGDGYPVGISLSVRENSEIRKWYLPFGHKMGGNLDKGLVVSWIKDLTKANREWVFANATYDLGWLRFLGVRPRGTIRCVQITEALLDEERSDGYSLNSLAKSYLGKTKSEEILRKAATIYGVHPKRDMWKLPARFVGLYAEDDAADTLQIFEKQLKRIEEEDLHQIFDLESRIIPMTHDMNERGIRIDIDRAERMNDRWVRDIAELEKNVVSEGINIWEPMTLARYCERKGLPYEKTEKGAPSFTKDNLPLYEDPIMKWVQILRQLDRIRKTYLHKNMIENSINGRIHPEFIQMANDDGGTKSGRYSCRNPNVQQIPVRSKVMCDEDTFSLVNIDNPVPIGVALRGNLIPEDGCHWLKLDYDSQEPRMQVHYALLKGFPGAAQAKQTFLEGGKLYTFIQQACGLSYDEAKAAHLGRSYEMSDKSFAEFAKLPIHEAEEVLMKLDEACPFIKLLQTSVRNTIDRRGFLRCIGGRKQRFDWWQPADWQRSNSTPVKGLGNAQRKWPNTRLHRAYKYRGLNRLIQGSSADQSKKGYLDAYEEGHLCILPLHDEGNWASISSEKEALQIKEIVENAYPMQLPATCEMFLGERWK